MADTQTITLTQRRIFIIPTQQGFALAFVLVLMLLGDINYNLSLACADLCADNDGGDVNVACVS